MTLPHDDDTRPQPDDTLDESLNPRVGTYRLVRELGHGGMGSVYLAVRDDDAFRKRVALKVLKRGMDTDAIVRRFRTERQILAGLDHPNIARLLDGGTTSDGRPYLVMEYVDGSPLVEFAEARRLDTPARLEMFLQVAGAVQYAHQNLIIHRDLKPANVLVTQEGVPKLLDFGIAKLLNPEMAGQTMAPTAAGLHLMTPEYASPEQVRGETVTTASDVYSLGVLLYELLTGTPALPDHQPRRGRHRPRRQRRGAAAAERGGRRAAPPPGAPARRARRGRPAPVPVPPQRRTRFGCGDSSKAISTTSSSRRSARSRCAATPRSINSPRTCDGTCADYRCWPGTTRSATGRRSSCAATAARSLRRPRSCWR